MLGHTQFNDFKTKKDNRMIAADSGYLSFKARFNIRS